MSNTLSDWAPQLATFEEFVSKFSAWRAHGQLAAPLRYALDGKGKRIRPLLCLLTAEALGGTVENALAPALAVELVHTYSLIHDDLPCMDDDDLRRGRPTVHKAFDEPTALLLGDGLLSEAYFVLTRKAAQQIGMLTPDFHPERAMAMVEEMGMAAGIDGMVEGQALDLYWTARQGADRSALDTLHSKKTGALLGAAAAMGAIAAGAEPVTVTACRLFGCRIGLVFQIIDDLLDDAETTGKSKGKDKEADKLTYATTMDRAEAQAAADHLTQIATSELQQAVRRPEQMIKLSQLLLQRQM